MGKRPHAVLLPLPGQGHMNPMLQVAHLLHSKGFYVTFVLTRSTRHSLLRSSSDAALAGSEDFRYRLIPDGVVLSRSGGGGQKQVSKGCVAYAPTCSAPLREILAGLHDGSGGEPPPGVTCVVYNWLMGFALDVAQELNIPALAFCTMSAAGFLGSYHLQDLIHKGYTPLKDEKYLTNGYLDTTIDWIPGMRSGIRLRDLSSFIRTTDGEDFFLKVETTCTRKCGRAQGLILNTFDRLEAEVMDAVRAIVSPKVYTLGPLSGLLANLATNNSPSMSTTMRFDYWKQDDGCMDWLDAQSPGSVIYVSFGSLTTLTTERMDEFAWGIVNSNHPFLWVIRPDMVAGENAQRSLDFVREKTTGGRSFIASWCMQEQVLSHPSVGGFLTHGGWNSMLESICAGVPMICWPGFAEQHTNCLYACEEWGVGMELDKEAKREDVSRLVKELMGGEGGKKLRKNAAKWKVEAKSACALGRSSYENLEKLAKDLSSGEF